MSFASMASDIVALLDFNGIKDAVLVGHSMGGKVAQATALLYPNRVSGLVVLDIAPVTYTQDDGSWRAVQTIIHAMNSIDLLAMNSRRDVDAALKKNGVEDPALRSFVMTNLNASASSTDVPKTNSALQNTALQWKINLPSIVKQLDVIAGFELPSEYNALQLQYHGDTFIISGGASRFIRSGHMKIISNFFPNHMLTTVRGVGHWIHAEAPDDTIALLKRYLDR
jgi:esterase